MKKKTIEKVLNAKFKHFLKSIEDETVRSLVEKNTIITGGCIVSYFLHETPSDFDLYFTNKETTKAVANYYVDQFKKLNKTSTSMSVEENDGRIKILIPSQGIAESPDHESYLEQDTELNLAVTEATGEEEAEKAAPYSPVFITDNAITLSGKIQIILRFYGKPEEIHKNFDFVHCTNYWTSGTRKLITTDESLSAILAKELIYVGSLYPVCSILRIRKFIKRGWTINAGQMLKMMFQLRKLDLANINVLKDQLIGVDSAYFNTLLAALKAHVNETGKLDETYFVTIVNKIFG